MKKLLSLALVLVTITSLFSTPLFAGETNRDTHESGVEIINSSELLDDLIQQGKDLLKNSDENDYSEGKRLLSQLKTSLEHADSSSFEDYYEMSRVVILKSALNNLNERKYMAEEALVPLKAVDEKLNEYKTKYYDLLNESKKNELDELIELIESYIKEDSEVNLTKGVFDDIMEREKAFDDPIVVLTVVLDSARILLFKDPNDPRKGYMFDRGDEVEEYIKDLTLSIHKTRPNLVESYINT